MTSHPPSPTIEPPRRHASGRLHRTRSWVAAVAVLAGACGSPPPRPPVTSTGAPTATPPAELAGLLVAARGRIQVTDQDGRLLAFGQPPAPVIAVSAGSSVVIAVADGGRAWSSAASSSGARSWTDLRLPEVDESTSRLLAVSPSGARVAIAQGELQARSFDLAFVDLSGPRRDVISVDRGLDGPPVWLGNDLVAVHVIRPDQMSTMGVVDIAGSTFDDGRPSAYVIAASADGRTVAFDDATTGEVLVGRRDDWLAGSLEAMARIANTGGTITRLALDGPGFRLGVVRSGEASSAVEILTIRDGRWQSTRTETIPGDGPVSIAWLR